MTEAVFFDVGSTLIRPCPSVAETFARVAAERGHDVTVWEKSKQIGGQLNLAVVSPGKQEMCKWLTHLNYRAKKAGVKFEFKKEATVENVKEFAPDAVVVATGATPLIPTFIKGVGDYPVITTHDILSRKVTIPKGTVCILGGGEVACEKGRVAFEKVLWMLVGVAIVDFMFFGKYLGVLSSTLSFEGGMQFAPAELWGNLLAIAATAGVMYLVYRRWSKHVFKAALAFVLAIAIMLPINIGSIHSQIKSIRQTMEESGGVPEYTMSKTGKNVIVLMLDRAVGAFLPYIFNEKPELQAQFDGFTAYTNVVSTGAFTNMGTPALMGGYEYTVDQINLRKDEKLVDKHNEALKMMPVLFDQNDFDVTVFDPIYANYQWVPDLSVFSDYPDIHRYITFGAFESDMSPKNWVSANMRNFFGYSLMKVCPVAAQSILYDNGNICRSLSAAFWLLCWKAKSGTR